MSPTTWPCFMIRSAMQSGCLVGEISSVALTPPRARHNRSCETRESHPRCEKAEGQHVCHPAGVQLASATAPIHHHCLTSYMLPPYLTSPKVHACLSRADSKLCHLGRPLAAFLKGSPYLSQGRSSRVSTVSLSKILLYNG